MLGFGEDAPTLWESGLPSGVSLSRLLWLLREKARRVRLDAGAVWEPLIRLQWRVSSSCLGVCGCSTADMLSSYTIISFCCFASKSSLDEALALCVC